MRGKGEEKARPASKGEEKEQDPEVA